MSEADQAYEAAQREIARVKAARGDELRLDDEAFYALDRLPPEISELTGLRGLHLDNTQITDLVPLTTLTRLQALWLQNTPITDLAPLAYFEDLRGLGLANTRISDLSPLMGLTGLQALILNQSRVADLRPIQNLEKLETDRAITYGDGMLVLFDRLSFLHTPATKRDARLAELALINNNDNRTRETLAYLRSLPPWPQPYIPAATPDGSPPQRIGGSAQAQKIKAANSQIRHLLNNAVVTRITAQQFASQIEDALRDVPATQGNNLPDPLQTMLEFAEVLRKLAPETQPATDPLERAKLVLRIAQLETLVDRLTGQLVDETKAREAAEALAGKGIFTNSFQAEAGKQVAKAVVWVPSMLISAGLYQAATHFLGVGNPVLDGLLRPLSKTSN